MTRVLDVETIKVSSLKKDETLVLSIDMNNGFCKSGPLSSINILDIVDETKEIFNKIKEQEILIVGYTDCHKIDAKEFNSYPIHCLENDEESKIIEELHDYIDIEVKKESTNGFLAKNPLTFIDASKLKSVILTGCCTDICVYQFAVTLNCYINQNNLDIEVIVAQNLVETFNSETHDRNFFNKVFLESLLSNGVKVVNLEI